LTLDSNLPSDSLESLVDALLDEIPEDNGSGVVITVKTESLPASPANGQKPRQKSPVYDPALVYILEFCTVLTLRDEKTVELLGKRVVEALQAILRDATNYHPILISRATFYLFRLLQASYVSNLELARDPAANDRQDHNYARVPVLLHSISSFSKDTLTKTSSLVLQGLKLCIDKAGPLRNEIMTSPDFWVILKTLATNGEAAPVVFDILESGVSGSPPAIMADNYVAAIALLNEFASLASVGAAAEQRVDRKQPRKPRSKQEKPR
jgi:brefeldin A-resistance guanine nucleotide exchange factor 1